MGISSVQAAIIKHVAAKVRQLMIKRIGIYAGAFDPVHTGHLTFALQALEIAKLDEIYFVPERRPRHKQGVEHFGHRVAMLTRALQPHDKLGIVELTDISFSVEQTLPKLEREFPDSQLVFLFGSDIIPGLAGWPKAERLLRRCELVIGLRDQDDRELVKQQIEKLPTQPRAVTIFTSYAPEVSSGKIRAALRRRTKAQGLLTSVERYSDRHWLYISLAQ